MEAHRLHNTVYARLDAIASAEKITRVELGHLSREALVYCWDTPDIDFINRLLGALTPANRSICTEFFGAFLPREVEKTKGGDFSRFGKLIKGEKTTAKRLEATKEFLADETNTVWTWAEENIEIEKKAKDLLKGFTSALANAVNGVEEKNGRPASDPIDPALLIAAMFANGVSIDAMLEACEKRGEELAQSAVLTGVALQIAA